MATRTRALLAAVVLIASCGPETDAAWNTQAAVGAHRANRATRPRAPTAAALPANLPAKPPAKATAGATADETDVPAAFAARPTDLPTGAMVGEAELVGFADARFVVFEAAGRVIVFDSADTAAFAFDGRVVRESAGPAAYDRWSEVGFAANALAMRPAAGADGSRVLARGAYGLGIAVVDLARRGRIVASLASDVDVRGAVVSPDGRGFAAWTQDAVYLVETREGAPPRTSVIRAAPSSGLLTADGDPPRIGWTERVVHFTDATGAHLVDRATGVDTFVSMSEAVVTPAADGATFAVWHDARRRAADGAIERPGVVEIWRAGDARARATVASSAVGDVAFDARGERAAWVEVATHLGEQIWLHTVDVATGVHVRFRARGEPCPIAAEHIVEIRGSELVTDAECSPGCPSLPHESAFVAYDVASGVRLRTWRGPYEAPYNVELSKRFAEADRIAALFGLSRDGGSLPLVHHPSGELVLARGEGDDVAVRIADGRDGKTVVRLRADALRATDVAALVAPDNAAARFSPDGRRVVAAGAFGIVIWDARTGAVSFRALAR